MSAAVKASRSVSDLEGADSVTKERERGKGGTSFCWWDGTRLQKEHRRFPMAPVSWWQQVRRAGPGGHSGRAIVNGQQHSLAFITGASTPSPTSEVSDFG
ncbi:hypothetical protein PoB_006441000 [Plakobranchus ocellatus]|uniref:Uncharacterized protein n=1 Tax=Plakobranchus ocellatus TaxID=259542 RepID=A0AAV4D1K0_9GAST|nr:hypothetical protein PoB_006441000 [Plakobranchus ocellatus]